MAAGTGGRRFAIPLPRSSACQAGSLSVDFTKAGTAILDGEGSSEEVTSNTLLVGAPTVGGGSIPAATLWWDGITIAKNVPDADAEATFAALVGGLTSDLMAENNELELEENSLDAIMLVLSFHDLYFAAPDQGWPAIDIEQFLAERMPEWKRTKPEAAELKVAVMGCVVTCRVRSFRSCVPGARALRLRPPARGVGPAGVEDLYRGRIAGDHLPSVDPCRAVRTDRRLGGGRAARAGCFPVHLQNTDS